VLIKKILKIVNELNFETSKYFGII